MTQKKNHFQEMVMAQSGKVPPLPLVPTGRLLLVGTATALTKCLLSEQLGRTTLSSLWVLNFESDAATTVGASEMLECDLEQYGIWNTPFV